MNASLSRCDFTRTSPLDQTLTLNGCNDPNITRHTMRDRLGQRHQVDQIDGHKRSSIIQARSTEADVTDLHHRRHSLIVHRLLVVHYGGTMAILCLRAALVAHSDQMTLDPHQETLIEDMTIGDGAQWIDLSADLGVMIRGTAGVRVGGRQAC